MTRVTCIDFNSSAPAAMREDTGLEKDRLNPHGWLAAGVPGTLAGLQLALDHFGTLGFRGIADPAIRLADEGVRVTRALASSIRSAAEQFRRDPASARVYLEDGNPPREGDMFRNPELAEMLRTLADRDSVDSFYRGDIAGQIAAEFQKHEGLVTKQDMADYRARKVAPLNFKWQDDEIISPRPSHWVG